MRFVAAVLLALGAAVAQAERILLIPLDSRPATGQFAQMIGNMANVNVVMPPYEDLGRFTTPGKPDEILTWLEHQDLGDVTAAVVSADMVAYGGLIASRTNDVTSSVALSRIRRLVTAIRRQPHVRLYVFSSTMRLTPTATAKGSKFRDQLARYEEDKAKFAYTHDAEAERVMLKLKGLVPKHEIDVYEATRARNGEVQRQLIRMQSAGSFDYLVIGQDDARPFGPHVHETERMRQLVNRLKLNSSVFFCEGVDQHACVLVSRAMLAEAQWQPRVRIVYSDDAGKELFASFESKPIKDSLSDQLVASGARPAGGKDEYDYTLYVNTPQRREDSFKQFLDNLQSDVDQGFPTAVADIDLARNGTADPELFGSLWENRRMMKLISYAGWNTAGNTMGTAIPAANVYMLARRTSVDPLLREIAQREFLLHRFVNDYAYHMFVRPKAYGMIKEDGYGSPDEIYGDEYDKVDQFVKDNLGERLDGYFKDQFLGRRFFAGTHEYAFSGITDIKIWLPWPRPYEVRLQFHLQAKPIETSGTLVP